MTPWWKSSGSLGPKITHEFLVFVMLLHLPTLCHRPPPFHLVGSLSPFCPAGFNPIQLPQPKLRSTSFGGRSSHMCLLCVVFRQDLSLSPHSLT